MSNSISFHEILLDSLSFQDVTNAEGLDPSKGKQESEIVKEFDGKIGSK